MKLFFAVLGLTALSIVPVQADTTPNLKGYICIDQKGIHHSWKSAFDGVTYCKLVLNKSR